MTEPIRVMSKLSQLSQFITTASDLDALLPQVVHYLAVDFGYTYSAVFLVNPRLAKLNLEAISIANRPLVSDVPQKTVIHQVLTTDKPLICNNFSAGKFQVFDYFSIDVQSEVAIPLIAGGQILGVLDVQSVEPNRYTTDDVDLLSIIANQLAVAVDNLRLVQERSKRLLELATFNQIGMIIAEQRDLDTILSNIVNRVRSLFQVEGLSLLLLENDKLRFVAASGAVSEEIKPFVLKPGQGIAWAAIESQRTIRVDDVKSDTRHYNKIDRTIGFTTHSLLAVPIRLQDKILGVLEAMNRIDGQPFNSDDETILEFIVSTVAVSIENARLFDQTRRHVDRVTGLLQASYALSTLDLQDILDIIVHKAGLLLEAAHTVVYLADYERQQIRATAVHSSGEMKNVPTPPFKFGEGTVGWVVDHRQSLRINDVLQDERFIFISPESPRIGNLVAVPLVFKGETIGVLEATHKERGENFTIEDEKLLTAFASQATIAIHNARLYQEKQQQVQALTTLTQTSDAITKANDFDQLLNIVLNSALSIIGATAGTIILVDPESQTLHIEAAQGVSSSTIAQFNQTHPSKSVGTFGEAFRYHQIIEVEDSTTDPRVLILEETAGELPKTFTNIPLFSGSDFVGVMTLHALPSKDNRALLQAVADMAAVAIDKARLFDEIGQRLAEVSTLYTLAEQMTRVLDLNRVVEYSVTILQHALGCSGASLFLKKGAGYGQTFSLKATSGWSVGPRQLELETNYIAQLAEMLSVKPYPINIKDVKESHLAGAPGFVLAETIAETDSPKQTSQIRSVMVVPLVVKEEVIGALSICDRQPGVFGQAEGRLLTIAAAQISTAIENVKLYDNLELRAIELEVALKDLAEANQVKSDFVQNVSHELRTPLTFILSYVELILEGTLGEISQVVRDKLEIVSQKTKVTTRLVDDIISLQKIETANLQLSVVTPYELITRTTYGATANASQYGIDVVSDCVSDLPRVQVDVDRIGQVFDNLVVNALKFSPSGTQITISAALDESEIRFSVQDQGVGIPEDKLDKIFERFYQVDSSTTRRYSGTGLGLAIIKQIIEVHKGRIIVESTPNLGTTFTFWLPIYRETEKPLPLSLN